MRAFAPVFRKLLPLLALALQATASRAQQEGQFVESSQSPKLPFTVISYSTKQGLPQSQVLDICSRKNGQLMLETANGIVEYDGQDFTEFITDKRYREYMSNELLWHEATQQLFANAHGKELLAFSPKFRLLRTSLAATLKGDLLYSIDRKGNLYRADVHQLHFYFYLATGIQQARALHIALPYIYTGTHDGLFRTDTRTHKTTRLSDGIFNGFKINPYTGALYAFSVTSVYRIGTPEPVFTVHDTINSSLTDVAFIGPKDYYVSSTNGLYAISAGTVTRYDKTTALPSNYIVSLYYNAAENCLFAGTGEKGLLKLQFKSCYSYSLEHFYAQSSLNSVIYDNDSSILVADTYGNLFRVQGTTVITAFAGHKSFASLANIDGNIYAGYWSKGAEVLHDGTSVYLLDAPQLPNSIVHAAFRDSRGTIWIGTDEGVACGKQLSAIKPSFTGKVTGVVICFYECRDGTICIGSSDGVFLFRPSGAQLHLSEKQGLYGKEVRSFYEDAEGKLWIGTYGGGLYCYHKRKLVSINRKANCHLFEDVFTLARDRFGYLNMTSNHGLWKIRERDLDAFYYGKLPYLVPFYVGQESGILNTEFNGGFQHNFLETKDGSFYFPSIEGLILHRPRLLPFRKLQPFFREIWVNDTLFRSNNRMMERSTHTLRFDVACPNYSDKYNLYFQFKLIGEGFPDTWSPLQKDNRFAFKMLPPGNYELMVRAVDAFNDRSPQVLHYTFSIQPYFYETLSFRIGGIIAILGLIALLLRLRVMSVSRKERHANSINNTILELKLKAIQAKMNPHFLFNALNNIRYLIVLEKLDRAETTLNDFSQLLRKFLQKSDYSFLAIEDEFEMLRLYLSIETFSFDDALTCTFDLDNELRQRLIPSMLLQPLVENAIKHGLMHSTGERLLHLQAVPTETGMRITITDNGIGLAASSEINKKRQEHVSHGLRLVLQKITIIREKYGIIVHFHIMDLPAERGPGTQVVVDIPFIDPALADK